MRGAICLLLPLLAGCAGSESDIRRAEFKEFFVDMVRGKDRGVGWYANSIQDAVTKPKRGRYQYRAPAHISNFLVARAVNGLGGTKTETSYDLALAADWLLYALTFDPTAAVRSNACGQLGRILVRLPAATDAPVASDLYADQHIAGSVNLPEEELPQRADELPGNRDAPIVMVCGIGKFSKATVLLLKSMGYRKVRSMKGGLNEWVRKGYPTTSSTAETA